jgi:hypothetical protein
MPFESRPTGNPGFDETTERPVASSTGVTRECDREPVIAVWLAIRAKSRQI